MRRLILLSIFATFLTAPAAVRAGESDPFTLSPMRIAQLKESVYLYTTAETTLNDMGAIINPALDNLAGAMARGAFMPSGGPVIVYQGSGSDRAKPFKLEVGYPAQGDTKPVDGFDVGKLDSVRAATAVYTGPIRLIGRAYGKLYPQLIAAGHTPSDTRRERYLYWESEDSPNNVVLIEILLQN
jgi:hypothetical protein